MSNKKKLQKRLDKLESRLQKLQRNGTADSAANKDVPRPAVGPFGPQEPPPPPEGPLRAMVIMAHPDDADFTSAGTVAKWCAEGWDVTYVVATGGDKGTHDAAMHPEKLAAIREAEQRAACKVLGVKE